MIVCFYRPPTKLWEDSVFSCVCCVILSTMGVPRLPHLYMCPPYRTSPIQGPASPRTCSNLFKLDLYRHLLECFLVTVRNIVAARLCFHRRLWFCSPGELCIPACTGADTLLGRHPPGRTPPPWADTPPPMTTAADSTHPTGMHSCYCPQHSYGKVMFLHLSVSHSVHRGLSGRHTSPGRHPQADTPLGRHPPGRHTTPGQTPLGQKPFPPAATAADGTHRTGMLSCSY